jgi:ribosomal-protein-alanine acetyltransferase
MISNQETSRLDRMVTVRPMSVGDVTDALVILHKSPEAAMWTAGSLMDVATSSAAWVAEENGEIVAFLAGRAVADEFEILNLAVDPAHRRHGIAWRLMGHALEYARRAGARRSYLEVRGSNAGAIALYSRIGFAECGRRPRYYQYPVEDAAVLALDLK